MYTEVPQEGSRRFATASGGTSATGDRPLRYRVEVERDLPFDPDEVAVVVHAALTDPRSWGGRGGQAFQRVDDASADLRVIIATPKTTDRLCAPVNTRGELSCRIADRAVINAERWAVGIPDYADRLDEYRIYVVNHEVGHALHHGHVQCPGLGKLAPVMMPQTKGVKPCVPNPWPYPAAIPTQRRQRQ